MGNPLAFPPPPTSVPFSQPANLANRLPNGECLDVRNVADDREVHSAIVPELRRAVNLTSNARALSRGTRGAATSLNNAAPADSRSALLGSDIYRFPSFAIARSKLFFKSSSATSLTLGFAMNPTYGPFAGLDRHRNITPHLVGAWSTGPAPLAVPVISTSQPSPEC